jgi:hypothetical protein
MGVKVSLTDKGPEIENPVRSMADVQRLRIRILQAKCPSWETS